jgi:hypothetical protein
VTHELRMFHYLFCTPQWELHIFTLATVHSLYSAPVNSMLSCYPSVPEDSLIMSAHQNARLYKYGNLGWHSIFLSSLKDINPMPANCYHLYVLYLSNYYYFVHYLSGIFFLQFEISGSVMICMNTYLKIPFL